jgi:N-methylhydantoinase A
MAGAIRLVSVERGHDPAKFAAMPFGGGGALHASALIKEIGLKCAIVPRFPGVTSALGCVIADLRHDQVHTVNLMLDGLDAAALDARMVAAGEEARGVVEAAGIAVERIDVLYEFDMHYLGQTHTVAVPLRVTLTNGHTGVSEAAIRTAFDKAYAAAFGRLLPGIQVRIVSLRTAAVGRRPAFDLTAFAPSAEGSIQKAERGERPVWFAGKWHATRVWSRLDLPAGAVIEAPAILEQPDATIFIEPGLRGRVDKLGNVIVERSA